MPRAAKKPCRQSGCPVLIDQSGYCEKHKKKAWESNTHRSKRLTGRPWRRLRDIVIRRDKGLCQPCYKAGIVTAFKDVDHVVPVSKGGLDIQSNLQCICKDCHDIKTATENR